MVKFLSDHNLYSSLRRVDLLKCVKMCITENNNEVSVITKFSVSVNTFSENLFSYFASAVGRDGQRFIQKSVVCIWYRLRPVLSNHFSSYVGIAASDNCPGLFQKIVRYVHNCVIFFRRLILTAAFEKSLIYSK